MKTLEWFLKILFAVIFAIAGLVAGLTSLVFGFFIASYNFIAFFFDSTAERRN